MSDFVPVRSHDTVVIPAALVFPGDPIPNMGPDTVRIPCRVVWREAEPARRPVGGQSPGAVRLPDGHALPGDGRGGDDPPPAVPAAPGPERPPSPAWPRADPIARFLEVNAALDRIMRGDAGPAPGATDRTEPTHSVSLANVVGVAMAGPRPPGSFGRGGLEEVGYRTKNVNNSTARALGMSRKELGDAIHKLKNSLGFRGDDDLELEVPSGDIFFNGENVGNLHDER